MKSLTFETGCLQQVINLITHFPQGYRLVEESGESKWERDSIWFTVLPDYEEEFESYISVQTLSPHRVTVFTRSSDLSSSMEQARLFEVVHDLSVSYSHPNFRKI